MHSFFPILFAIFAFKFSPIFGLINTNENQCRLQHRWSCGATPSTNELSLSEQMSCQVAAALCPTTRNAVNECCLVHDACYLQKLGQMNCDDRFCQCLACATKNDGPLCELKVGQGFCVAVRLFGGLTYRRKR